MAKTDRREETVSFTVRLPETLYRRLSSARWVREMTMADLVRFALERELSLKRNQS